MTSKRETLPFHTQELSFSIVHLACYNSAPRLNEVRIILSCIFTQELFNKVDLSFACYFGSYFH